MKAISRGGRWTFGSIKQLATASGIALALAIPAILMPVPASAVDINGIVNTAIALHYARLYARLPGRHAGGHAVARHESDDDDDDGGNSKSAGSAGSPGSHNSSRPGHGSHDVAQSGSSDEMVTLDRSYGGPDRSR